MKNKLSLAVGTYKNPDLIIRTLKGLLMQSFKDFKIYVFDDNDPNDVEMVNETYDKIMMLKDERITYVKNDFNIGLWVVADNLRKGAALNSVQIGEALIKKFLK